VFYTLLFGGLAILLVVAGLMVMSRNRRQLHSDPATHGGQSHAGSRQRKAQRTQSKQARRKRH